MGPRTASKANTQAAFRSGISEASVDEDSHYVTHRQMSDWVVRSPNLDSRGQSPAREKGSDLGSVMDGAPSTAANSRTAKQHRAW